MTGRRDVRRRSWARHGRLAKLGYLATAVATMAVMVLSLGTYVVYLRLDGNIHSVNVSGLTSRSVYGAQNILLLGSQTRIGQHGHFGPDLYTNNSDNLLLVHLDATHTHATILSIPRDTMVYEPGCRAVPRVGHGVWGPYTSAIIDGAMNIGGPSCAVSTVEDLTGIRLDHFVEFDFNSFRAMVDALGGVKVCVPPGGYHDPWSGLHLGGGTHLLTYNQALAYVRTRHGVGSGGDLGRIELQQAFISSVIQKTDSDGILTNSVSLLKIADTATRALTVDQGLDSVDKLLSLAKTLTGLHARDVTLLTMPTVLDPADPNRLLPEEPADDEIFQLVRTGVQWHRQLPTLPPHRVEVRVLNGTGRPGLAARTAASLRRLGFDVVSVGDASPASATTVSYAGTAQAESAGTLMASLNGTPSATNLLREPASQRGRPGPVTLTIGADFAGVSAATAAPHSRAGAPTVVQGAARGITRGVPAVQARNAAASICSGIPSANPNPGTPP